MEVRSHSVASLQGRFPLRLMPSLKSQQLNDSFDALFAFSAEGSPFGNSINTSESVGSDSWFKSVQRAREPSRGPQEVRHPSFFAYGSLAFSLPRLQVGLCIIRTNLTSYV